MSLIMNESPLDECILVFQTVEGWGVSRGGTGEGALARTELMSRGEAAFLNIKMLLHVY